MAHVFWLLVMCNVVSIMEATPIENRRASFDSESSFSGFVQLMNDDRIYFPDDNIPANNDNNNNNDNNVNNNPSPVNPTTNDRRMTECIRSCPRTSEYNPLCTDNQVQYDNIGALQCAEYCSGRSIVILYSGICTPVIGN